MAENKPPAPRAKRSFTEEFKQDAVRLKTIQKYSFAAAAKALVINEQCLPRWHSLLGSEVSPTNDPNSLYCNPPGSIFPLGGAQGYMGFGLAQIVNIFAGAITGAYCGREKPVSPIGNAVFMMILDPVHFGGAEHFKQEVELLVETVRNTPRIEGVERITLPGDPERANPERMSIEGIEIDHENWAVLTADAEKLGVASTL